MQHKESIIVGVLVALIFGGVGYTIGTRHTGSNTQTEQNGATRQFSGSMNGTGTGFPRGTRTNGGGFVSGSIIAKDDTSITVKTRSNGAPGSATSETTGTKIIFLAPSTQITKSTSGATSDLSVGKEVTVTGSTNPDGSLTAKTVALRPENMGAPGAGTMTPAPTKAP